jgi:hypothetical protein
VLALDGRGAILVRVVDTFTDVVAGVMRDGRPSSGPDLSGMEMDIDAYLSMVDGIDQSSVRIQRTGRANRLLRAWCRVAHGAALDDAARAVTETWMANLRYSFLEAHRLVMSEHEAVLDFVTQIGTGRLYVTGDITVVQGTALVEGGGWIGYEPPPHVARAWNVAGWQPPAASSDATTPTQVKLMPEYGAELPLWLCEWWDLELDPELLDALADWQATFDGRFDPSGGWLDPSARDRWAVDARLLVERLRQALPAEIELVVDL